jgi:hypothetical protein
MVVILGLFQDHPDYKSLASIYASEWLYGRLAEGANLVP